MIQHDSAGGAGSAGKVVNYYAGVSLNTPIEALKVGASYDYQGRAGSGAAGGANSSSYANAASIYTSYAVTEKIKVNTRAEYASGTSSAFSASAPFVNAAKAAVGSNSEFLSLTGTVDYALWANVTSRAEVRWDADVSGGPQPFGGAADEKNAVTVSLNIIYKF